MSFTNEMPFNVIERSEQLDIAVNEMSCSSAIALDTESNSLHRYPEQLCLIQIATLETIYIIDTIALHEISSLRKILEDGSVIKVIHGADYDVRSLDRHGGFRIQGLYDTYIAARFSGVPKVGLGDLLRELLGVDIPKSKELQHADWGRRPLSADALEYAAEDVRHLLALKQILDQRLQSMGRTGWVSEECLRIQNARYTPLNSETSYFSIKGAQRLDRHALAVLKSLFLFREGEAQRQHRPPFFVLPDVALIYLSNNPSANLADVPGVGRDVERIGQGLRQALREGQNAPPVERQRVEYEPLNPGQLRILAGLKAWRESLGRVFCLDPSLLWPTASLERLAKTPDSLAVELKSPIIRAWQRHEFASSLDDYLKAQMKK